MVLKYFIFKQVSLIKRNVYKKIKKWNYFHVPNVFCINKKLETKIRNHKQNIIKKEYVETEQN